MIFGNKGIQIKTRNLVLRLPKYDDFESWFELRTVSREFWKFGSQKEVGIFLDEVLLITE